MRYKSVTPVVDRNSFAAAFCFLLRPNRKFLSDTDFFFHRTQIIAIIKWSEGFVIVALRRLRIEKTSISDSKETEPETYIEGNKDRKEKSPIPYISEMKVFPEKKELSIDGT